MEAAGARPHRDFVHLPLVPARAAPAAALALPVLPAFAAAAAIVAAAAVVAPRVVLLPPEARPEAAAEFVHPARPLLEILKGWIKMSRISFIHSSRTLAR